MDPLIEHPPLLLLLDLVLLKPRVYLHLLFNRGHPPKDGGPRPKNVLPSSKDALPGIWLDWLRLIAITVAAETASRLIALSPVQSLDALTTLWTVASVSAEVLAQHAMTTLVALVALRIRGWRTSRDLKEVQDGRQKHFKPIMISLTLLYSSILPLLLQLVLGIWQSTDYRDQAVDRPPDLTILSHVLERLPESAGLWILATVNGLVAIWNRTDLIWAGTRLLGGMSAAFGLRVILPTRPIEMTMIVLAGWAAADFTCRLAHQIK